MTPTLAAALAGAALGLALWALFAARWARPTLAERLAAPPPPRSVVATGPDTGVLTRLGKIGIPVLEGFGMPGPRTRRNLRVCERSPESYLAEKFTALVLALAFPPLLGGMLSLIGILPSATISGGMWVAFALVVWFAPDMSLRDEADKRREQMRRALASFADLVVVSLAGGAGVNGALADAGAAGNGWAMARIRESLREAVLMRQPPWTALRDLGERYDTPEFAELSASLQLAGADGARIRSSLAAKARTLRTQFLSEMDAEAQSATERMSLPVVLLFAGFLALLGYPAMSHILFSS
ncbi:type II secretion system F family protein [Nocardiopsis dassonvillei]|uniref:type II secretion system F family protein n=1 Tax=Nocardiopsis dassonvillei TaxID=2014 RepID=UPI003F5633F3